MKRRVVITGASSGIGAALAGRYSDSDDLLLTGTRAESKAETPEGSYYISIDQSFPEQACVQLAGKLDELDWDGIDLAVLNAGTGTFGDPDKEMPDTIRKTMDVNLNATIALSHSLYPRLEKAGGQLVLIGSVAYKGAPKFASYAASKAGLHGFGRALHQEWHGRVKVQVIHPGPAITSIHERAGFQAGPTTKYFFRAETMARMIDRLIMSGKPTANASYGYYLTRGFWWQR